MNAQPMPDTEFPFTLPQGLLDARGGVHRQGMMRLATGKDEFLLKKDFRVRENPAYGIIYALSRVITRLGNHGVVTPELLEQLFLPDLVYLRQTYNRINPQSVEVAASGELSATPWSNSSKR